MIQGWSARKNVDDKCTCFQRHFFKCHMHYKTVNPEYRPIYLVRCLKFHFFPTSFIFFTFFVLTSVPFIFQTGIKWRFHRGNMANITAKAGHLHQLCMVIYCFVQSNLPSESLLISLMILNVHIFTIFFCHVLKKSNCLWHKKPWQKLKLYDFTKSGRSELVFYDP